MPVFEGKGLSELTREDLKAFSLSLASPAKCLTANTRNRVLVVGTTALKWAFENAFITADLTAGIRKFSGEVEKRGVLTPDEARDLFSLEWDDERHYLANFLAATTGMRAGEIAALKVTDLADTSIQVRHSWLEGHGLKTPKNGEARTVPVMPALLKRLVDLARMNPNGIGFVFWNPASSASPMDSRRFALQLRRMLTRLRAGDSATPTEEKLADMYWDERNVVFHSWRHFFSSRMSDSTEDRKVMKLTGHKTPSVFAGYSEHRLESELAEMGGVAASTFGHLLPSSWEARA